MTSKITSLPARLAGLLGAMRRAFFFKAAGRPDKSALLSVALSQGRHGLRVSARGLLIPG